MVVVEATTVSELIFVVLVSRVVVKVCVVVMVTVLSALARDVGVDVSVMVMSVDTTISVFIGGGVGFMHGTITLSNKLQSEVTRVKVVESVDIKTHCVFSSTDWKNNEVLHAS